jgi:hypothetical protein
MLVQPFLFKLILGKRGFHSTSEFFGDVRKSADGKSELAIRIGL